jgi:gas vesicle protein
MSENARAAMRDATIGRIERMTHNTTETSKYVGSTTVQRIKQNPGPAALAALGISWLFMGGKGSGTQTQSQSQPEYGTNQSSTGSVMDSASNVGSQIQETASDAAGTVAGQVQDGMDTAMNQVHQVADQAQNMASDAATTVQQSAGQVTTAMKQVPSKTRSMVEENPVPLGLVAIALGSAAALAIPGSRKEHQIMGEARDALMETAKTKGHEVAEKAQDMVEGMQTTMENVEEMVTEKSEK